MPFWTVEHHPLVCSHSRLIVKYVAVVSSGVKWCQACQPSLVSVPDGPFARVFWLTSLWTL